MRRPARYGHSVDAQAGLLCTRCGSAPDPSVPVRREMCASVTHVWPGSSGPAADFLVAHGRSVSANVALFETNFALLTRSQRWRSFCGGWDTFNRLLRAVAAFSVGCRVRTAVNLADVAANVTASLNRGPEPAS